MTINFVAEPSFVFKKTTGFKVFFLQKIASLKKKVFKGQNSINH